MLTPAIESLSHVTCHPRGDSEESLDAIEHAARRLACPFTFDDLVRALAPSGARPHAISRWIGLATASGQLATAAERRHSADGIHGVRQYTLTSP